MHPNTITVVVSLCFLSLCTRLAIGAEPTDIATIYNESIISGDFDTTASLYDPEELNEFRELLRIIYESSDDYYRRDIDALFGEQATASSISQLSDQEFYAAFLNMSMSTIREQFPFEIDGIEVLGVIYETPSVAHVLTRTQYAVEAGEIADVDVLSMRRSGNVWRLLMKSEVKLTAKIRNEFAEKRQ